MLPHISNVHCKGPKTPAHRTILVKKDHYSKLAATKLYDILLQTSRKKYKTNDSATGLDTATFWFATKIEATLIPLGMQ